MHCLPDVSTEPRQQPKEGAAGEGRRKRSSAHRAEIVDGGEAVGKDTIDTGAGTERLGDHLHVLAVEGIVYIQGSLACLDGMSDKGTHAVSAALEPTVGHEA